MMQVKDLKPSQGNVEVVLEIYEMEEPREFNKFGRQGRVANAKARDETGEIQLTLWNEQVEQIKPVCKVHIQNGYVKEWQGELQISTGRFGTMKIVE